MHDVNLSLFRSSYFLAELIKAVNLQQPDVVVITGELQKEDCFEEESLTLLNQIKAPVVYNGTNAFKKVPNNFHCITEEGYVELNELIFMKVKSGQPFVEELGELKVKLKKKKTQMRVLLENDYSICSKHTLKDYNISLVLTGFEERHKNLFYTVYDFMSNSAMSLFHGEDVLYFVNYGMNLLYGVMRFHKNHIGVIDIKGKKEVSEEKARNRKKLPWFKKIFG